MCISFFNKKEEKALTTGLIPSPFDSRDIKLTAVQAPIPVENLPESFIIPYNLGIQNQNNYPACVGFSSAILKGVMERNEHNLVDFDGKWIYDRCKEMDGMPNMAGTYFRMGLKILKDKGAKPLLMNESEAGQYKIGAYASVDDMSFEGLKKAIRQNSVLLAGFRGSNAGWQSAYVRPPKTGEEVWGHAVALIGFNKDYLIFQNSWGQSWGDKGIGYVSADYLPFEAWACLVDLPNDFVQVEKPTHNFARDMRYGWKGQEVVALQNCLKYLGVFPQIIESTGYFGKITEQAVKTFEMSYNLPITGEVKGDTRMKLNNIFA